VEIISAWSPEAAVVGPRTVRVPAESAAVLGPIAT
jgi:hypothetical protein